MDLVTVADATERAGIGRRTLMRYLASGRLTHHGRDGSGRVRVDLDELLRLMRTSNPNYFGSRKRKRAIA